MNKECECHCHNETSLPAGVRCKCIKNCEHCNPKASANASESEHIHQVDSTNDWKCYCGAKLTIKHPKQSPDWEERFDEEFCIERKIWDNDDPYGTRRHTVKAFIKEEIQKAEKRIAEKIIQDAGLFMHPFENWPDAKQQLRDKYLKGDNE